MSTIDLPADCGREAAATLWSRLHAAPVGSVTLNGAGVQRIGQAMLQVLLMAGGSAVLAAPSPVLASAARLAGLNRELLGEAGQ